MPEGQIVASNIADGSLDQHGPGDGQKRTYLRRTNSKDRGIGMYPEFCEQRGAATWSEPISKAPFAEVPSVGATMTLHASAVEVPGYTLFFVGTKSYHDGLRHDYKCEDRRIRIHDVAMPQTPPGMPHPPAMLVCSLPLVNARPGSLPRTASPAIESPMPPIDDSLVARTKKLVAQFRQVILYGPPGTGKTRLARQVALSLLDPAKATPDVLEDNAHLGDALEVFSHGPDKSFDLVVFHPSYEYEQFIGGIAADTSTGELGYVVEEGVFLRLCNAKRAVLIVDEINRGNLSKLLGELVYALEYRESEVTLPFKRQTGPHQGHPILKIPKELFVIATMNSSDRSIGHIDVAVRRRFGLIPVGPDSDVVRTCWKRRFPNADEGFVTGLVTLMERINLALMNDNAELGIGQSYFLPDDESQTFAEAQTVVRNRWTYQVRPLLDEYDVMVGVNLPDFLKGNDLDVALRALRTQAGAIGGL